MYSVLGKSLACKKQYIRELFKMLVRNRHNNKWEVEVSSCWSGTHRTLSQNLTGIVHPTVLVVLLLPLILEKRIFSRVKVLRLLLHAGTQTVCHRLPVFAAKISNGMLDLEANWLTLEPNLR